MRELRSYMDAQVTETQLIKVGCRLGTEGRGKGGQDRLLQDLKQQLEESRARVRELRSYMDAQVMENQVIMVGRG